MGSAQSSSAGEAAATATTGGSPDGRPEKLGAGLLFTCNGEVLLLRRNSRHNHGTWGLPGGNADDGDGSLLETAMREAKEELGSNIPPFNVVAEVLTKRGKRGQKHYTVFVAALRSEHRAAWHPQLNEEHSAWQWFNLSDLLGRGKMGQTASPSGEPVDVELHPVVALALHTQPHRQVVLSAIGTASQR